MTEHKATPEQWAADRYDWTHADTEAMDGDSAFRCILELRARVEALEAAVKPAESNYPAKPDSSLIDEARAYLAQPKPQAPSKHELFQVLLQSGGATKCVSIEWLEPFAHAVLERWGNSMPKPNLTVQNCNNMRKHAGNYIAEDFGMITLDGLFTREDLIEIANTVPRTEA